MRKRRSRTMSFSDEEWIAITAGAELSGLNRSVYIAQLARQDVQAKDQSVALPALIKAREDLGADA
jgi:hypothetical protein